MSGGRERGEDLPVDGWIKEEKEEREERDMWIPVPLIRLQWLTKVGWLDKNSVSVRL